MEQLLKWLVNVIEKKGSFIAGASKSLVPDLEAKINTANIWRTLWGKNFSGNWERAEKKGNDMKIR